MNISSISKREHGELYTEYFKRDIDVNISPNGHYRLKTTYKGEFPHGDAYVYCELFEEVSGKLIWNYKTGDPIRENRLVRHWSFDSENLYFSLINGGNQIIKFDTETGNNEILFSGESNGGNRLCWLKFVPISFNGVVFSCDVHDGKTFDTFYYVYIEKSNDVIELHRFFSGRLWAFPSSEKNCINILNEGIVYTFDVVQKIVLEKTLIAFTIDNKSNIYLSELSDTTISMTYMENSEKKYACIKDY